MDTQLLVVFGLPGSGKSYISKIIKDNYGFAVYDGDDVIPFAMKKALLNKKPIPDKLRNTFNKAMLSKLKLLTEKYSKLVFMQTLLKDEIRQKIHNLFPYGKFIFVMTNNDLREERYTKRIRFNLGLKYLRQTSKIFEEPSISYIVINNDINGQSNIIKQLNFIFSSFA